MKIFGGRVLTLVAEVKVEGVDELVGRLLELELEDLG